MTTSSSQEVRFLEGAGGPRYHLVGLTHPDSADEAYEIVFTDDLYGAEYVSHDFGGDDQLFFDMYGMPDSGGSIVISVGGHVRTVTIDAETGRASTIQ
jgi:hypothetical protein